MQSYLAEFIDMNLYLNFNIILRFILNFQSNFLSFFDINHISRYILLRKLTVSPIVSMEAVDNQELRSIADQVQEN